MVSADVRKQHRTKKIHRGSQVVLGERKHLEEVLRSVASADIPAARKKAEVGRLRKLIQARTAELNCLNPSWDRKFAKACNPRTAARELLRLAANLPLDDYLLARVLTEHAQAPPELLESLAAHPYAAVRENVARHPHTPIKVLEGMADDRREPLWFLVAANPSTPVTLRERLRQRMRGVVAR